MNRVQFDESWQAIQENQPMTFRLRRQDARPLHEVNDTDNLFGTQREI